MAKKQLPRQSLWRIQNRALRTAVAWLISPLVFVALVFFTVLFGLVGAWCGAVDHASDFLSHVKWAQWRSLLTGAPA